MIWPFLCIILAIAYGLMILRCWGAWIKLPTSISKQELESTSISVIIAVRNEAGNILHLLQDLERQVYAKEYFEVIIVDDHSDDDTPQLIREFAATSSLTIKLLLLASFTEKRQKKAAIETGIAAAKGEWILLTDGDCRVQPLWVATFNQAIQQFRPKLISGPVLLSPTKGWFQQLQALEFSALIGVGAASISLQKPNMCNGANIAYEKAAFYAVNGFAGNEQIASGDDEFLLHKMHKHYPDQITFLKVKEAVVQTPPSQSVQSFLQQRVRWASKWKHYQVKHVQLLAILVVGANVSVLISFFMGLLQVWPWWIAIIAVSAKILPDTLFLSQILGFFGRRKLILNIGLLQVMYVPYILLTGILGFKGNYRWKGRQL